MGKQTLRIDKPELVAEFRSLKNEISDLRLDAEASLSKTADLLAASSVMKEARLFPSSKESTLVPPGWRCSAEASE